MKILTSITTVLGADWQAQLQESAALGLEEIAVFLTGLNPADRKVFYREAKKIKFKKIPFVHIRHDFTAQEIGYLAKEFKMEKVNIHFIKEHLPRYDISEFKKIIYVENHPGHSIGDDELAVAEEIIKKYAGICLDVAHLESDRREDAESYQKYTALLKKYPCGCGHISAVKSDKMYDKEEDRYAYDWHTYKELGEFDYLKRYEEFLPPIAALELTNSITEQLTAKNYIEKLLR